MDWVFPLCFNSSAIMTASWGDEVNDLQHFSDCIRDNAVCKVNAYMNIGGERRMELPEGWDRQNYTANVEAPGGVKWQDYFSFKNTLDRISEESHVKLRTLSTEIAENSTLDAFEFSGSGAIKAIVLTVSISTWDNLSWEMTWNHAEEPQVQVPFNRLYNAWTVGSKPLMGYQVGASETNSSVTAYIFYPMPFLKNAVGRIFNNGSQPVGITGSILYKLTPDGEDAEYLAGRFGYYHAKWVSRNWATCFNELLSLQNQTGHMVNESSQVVCDFP